jgi:SET domain-containing protein
MTSSYSLSLLDETRPKHKSSAEHKLGLQRMTWSEYSFILKPSKLGGVGVFATHDIAKNTELFCSSFELRKAYSKDIPKAFLPYCIYISSDEVICPQRFDRMEIGWFINHSFEPNIAPKNLETSNNIISKYKSRIIYALADIKSDEEILMDYNSLNEPDHLKEKFYLR